MTEITQADRDAAADWLEAWEPGPEMTVVKLARAFAAHRIAALSAPREPSEAMNTCEMPEVTAMRYVEELRAGYGNSITILCDDEEATYKSEQMAIEVCAMWTDHEPRRFYGETVLQCLAKAMIAAKEAE